MLYAALSVMPSLAEACNYASACEIIHGSKDSDITIIRGWNTSEFMLTPGELGNDKPVIVLNLSLHGMIMNDPARQYLERDYSDIVLNLGDPFWTEKNLPRLLGMIIRIASPGAEEVKSFGRSLMQAGIVAMEDMLLPGTGWLGLVHDSPVDIEFWADEDVFAGLTPDERRRVNGVKLFADGALGTRTACLAVPYLSGERGILLMEDSVMADKLHGYMKQGIPVAVHAIGDSAVERVVKTLVFLRRERGCSGPVRIEHAQFITRDAAFASKDAGIILSMQPNFSMDSVMYADRLPRGYPSLNNPFRMLIDKAGFIPGKDLLFGSDGMPHGIQPAMQSSLFPPYAGQALTPDEFTDGYCVTGADPVWMIHIGDDMVRVHGCHPC